MIGRETIPVLARVLPLARTDRPGMRVQRGELLVYLRRLGYPAVPAVGGSERYGWLGEDDPYEHAIELAESGQVEPTLEAFTILDRLGAAPAAVIVRRRLRALGVTRIPRRPQPGTPTDPAGLTDRQLEIVRLIATGLSDAEIAHRLVVSPRTVDRSRLRRLAQARRADQARRRGMGRRAREHARPGRRDLSNT